MPIIFYRWIMLLTFLSVSYGGGISIDSGLTPPLNRVIFRTQARFMNQTMANSGIEMTMRGNPLVLAYGLSSKLALIGRIIHMTRLGNAMAPASSGWNDILLMAKFKLWRENTASQTIGLAGVLAGEIPTGSRGFSSDTYAGIAGFQGSLRRGSLALELNLETKLAGLFTKHSEKKRGEWALNSALAWLIPVGSSGNMAVTPVVEFTRVVEWKTEITGKQFWISPGMKLTISSFIIEGLFQYPVSQASTAQSFTLKPGGLIGIRLMF
ncbi:MAG: hypothetical protein V3S48_04090 [Candidatus Neomarinimicrobiota bacterium]